MRTMSSTTVTVGLGQSAPGMEPRAPIQQLGAAPGTSEGVPGYEGNEPEDYALEFASSGEAENAPRDDTADFDEELSPEMLTYINNADLNAREAARVLLVGYESGGAEREIAGEGTGVGREEAHNGSNPA